MSSCMIFPFIAEQVHGYEAGPVLDARIAEYALGWSWFAHDGQNDRFLAPADFAQKNRSYCRVASHALAKFPIDQSEYPIPAFSTDLNAGIGVLLTKGSERHR